MQPELRLYDTAARAKRRFEPIDHDNVRLYACGPTVYDLAHIGNARPVIVFDVLFRLLRHRYGAGHVTYVRNVTDVDDKINARAAERGLTIRELTDGTLAQFHKDIAALGVLMPEDVNVPGEPPRMIEPRATDHIPEMRDLIERLIARGHAYVAQDHALFDVPSMAAYGRLSRRPLDEMVAGARVEVAPYKRSPLDFVLWKPSREGEPAWPSPGGIAVPGRPGWHIECSAMSWRHLVRAFEGRIACEPAEAQTFDIHAGGLDLIFPHHENEIAQSCCALGTGRMANYWLHNGFLQVEGAKMAKSAGNFTTIRDVLRDWPGEVVRLAMLKTHYREPIDWTIRALEEAASTLARWRAAAGILSDETVTHPDPDVLSALMDDLNTPKAFVQIHSLASRRLHAVANEDEQRRLWSALRLLGLSQSVQDLSSVLHRAGQVSTYKTEFYAGQPTSFDELVRIDAIFAKININQKLKSRIEARAARDFAESDRIRDELAAQGVKLTDHKDGTTTWEVAR